MAARRARLALPSTHIPQRTLPLMRAVRSMPKKLNPAAASLQPEAISCEH
jgi:hypothetical protein